MFAATSFRSFALRLAIGTSLALVAWLAIAQPHSAWAARYYGSAQAEDLTAYGNTYTMNDGLVGVVGDPDDQQVFNGYRNGAGHNVRVLQSYGAGIYSNIYVGANWGQLSNDTLGIRARNTSKCYGSNTPFLVVKYNGREAWVPVTTTSWHGVYNTKIPLGARNNTRLVQIELRYAGGNIPGCNRAVLVDSVFGMDANSW